MKNSRKIGTLAKVKIISISFSVALAEWSFEHQFCLTPS
jgi:hypothetical protein